MNKPYKTKGVTSFVNFTVLTSEFLNMDFINNKHV